jgi:hypothetical protein
MSTLKFSPCPSNDVNEWRANGIPRRSRYQATAASRSSLERPTRRRASAIGEAFGQSDLVEGHWRLVTRAVQHAKDAGGDPAMDERADLPDRRALGHRGSTHRSLILP